MAAPNMEMVPVTVPDDAPVIKVDVICDEEALLRIPDDEEDQSLEITLAVHATPLEVQSLCQAIEDMELTCGEKSTAGTCGLFLESLFEKLAEHGAAEPLRPGAVLVRRNGDSIELEVFLRGGNRCNESYRRFFAPCWWPKPQGGNGARVLGLVKNHYDHWLWPNMCPGDEYECETQQCRDCERGDTSGQVS